MLFGADSKAPTVLLHGTKEHQNTQIYINRGIVFQRRGGYITGEMASV